MSFFISDAVAATGAPAQGSPMSLILMLVVFGLIFYFMILRPQQKRTKEHKNLMNSIAKGDEVLTNGGLVGRVTKVAESGYIAIALNDTTEVVIKRDFVAAVLPKGAVIYCFPKGNCRVKPLSFVEVCHADRRYCRRSALCASQPVW